VNRQIGKGRAKTEVAKKFSFTVRKTEGKHANGKRTKRKATRSGGESQPSAGILARQTDKRQTKNRPVWGTMKRLLRGKRGTFCRLEKRGKVGVSERTKNGREILNPRPPQDSSPFGISGKRQLKVQSRNRRAKKSAIPEI